MYITNYNRRSDKLLITQSKWCHYLQHNYPSNIDHNQISELIRDFKISLRHELHLHCKQKSLIFLTFSCFDRNCKAKKHEINKIHVWGVFFLQTPAEISMIFAVPALETLVNNYYFWSCDSSHFCAISRRAAISRACALLTQRREWANII